MAKAKRIIDLSTTFTPDNKPTSNTKNKSKGNKKGSIGEFAVLLIKNDSKINSEELAKIVRNKFNSKTSSASIAWYKNKIKKGEL